MRAVFDAPDRQRADWLSQSLVADLQTTAPKGGALWEAGIKDA